MTKTAKITKLMSTGGAVNFHQTPMETWANEQAMLLQMSYDEYMSALRMTGAKYLKKGDLLVSDEELKSLVVSGKITVR